MWRESSWSIGRYSVETVMKTADQTTVISP
jgi:hypothetical protein